MSAIGLCVNPMSGRDVRRLAARASNMTHGAKRDIVARIACGADAVGISDIYTTREPYRIASQALEHIDLKAMVHCLDLGIANDASDTERAIAAFLEAGCKTLVSLGGDGTNRVIVRALLQHLGVEACRDISLIPLSTGTNNVFPSMLEPTVAGMAAALAARGDLPLDELGCNAKVLHISLFGAKLSVGRVSAGTGLTSDQVSNEVSDVALIDAVLLRSDHVGNLLPFDPDKIDQLVLTRAEPDAVGMSPIGGYLDPVFAEDDRGLFIDMHRSLSAGVRAERFLAPLSPGLFREVAVKQWNSIDFDLPVVLRGPGVIALDGDRDHKLTESAHARVVLRRDGPRVLDVPAVMRYAQAQGMIGAL